MDITVKMSVQNPRALANLGAIPAEAVYRALKDYIRTVHERVRMRTPEGEKGRRKGYILGTMVKSWEVFGEGTGSVGVQSAVPYAGVLEWGRYKGLGPRTAASEGGIYSQQAVGGILRPLLAEAGFLDEVVETIRKEIVRSLA